MREGKVQREERKEKGEADREGREGKIQERERETERAKAEEGGEWEEGRKRSTRERR